jgi:hypothetical protein
MTYNLEDSLQNRPCQTPSDWSALIFLDDPFRSVRWDNETRHNDETRGHQLKRHWEHWCVSGFQGRRLKCCSVNFSDFHPECFPIRLPEDDPVHGKNGEICEEYARSGTAPRIGCTLGSSSQQCLMLPVEGLHGKHAVQLGIWLPTQDLLWDQGKPPKTLIELAGQSQSQSQKSHCDRQSVSQSVCLGVKSKSWTFPPQSYCFVFLGRPLWREVGSVMCRSLSLKSTIVWSIYNNIYI